MTTAQPGWYPDPENPAGVRWYDGTTWTEHRGPAVAAAAPAWSPQQAAWPPAPARSGSRGAIVAVCIVGGFFALMILAAIAIPVFLNQRAKAEVSSLSTVTCESLGAEAVATSQANVTGGQIPLASVSGLTIAQDNRATVRRPSPGAQSFVLSCSGTALWQDGVSTPLLVELDIDSAVQHVVTFTWDE